MRNTKTGLDQKCARCGVEEFRCDGYCSVECRDMHEVEEERDEAMAKLKIAEEALSKIASRMCLIWHTSPDNQTCPSLYTDGDDWCDQCLAARALKKIRGEK